MKPTKKTKKALKTLDQKQLVDVQGGCSAPHNDHANNKPGTGGH